jgi:hypothetical protein
MKVLIIYQGKKANVPKPYRAHLVEYISTKHQSVTVKKLDDGQNSFETNYYDKFIEMVRECDAAIALITKDIRHASGAGNAWLEIGLWCGKKSAQNLLLLVDNNVKSLPSDIPYSRTIFCWLI